jgi:hypothetical protein
MTRTIETAASVRSQQASERGIGSPVKPDAGVANGSRTSVGSRSLLPLDIGARPHGFGRFRNHACRVSTESGVDCGPGARPIHSG